MKTPFVSQIPKSSIVFAGFVSLIIVATIITGNLLQQSGVAGLRIWPWQQLWLVPAFFAVALLQQKAGLPPVTSRFGRVPQRAAPWLWGIVFGLLDVLVIKIILHPEPYTSLPPFLQPFPYALLLFSSGAFEVDFTYRLLPLTVILLFAGYATNAALRKYLIIGIGILSSLAEPLLQLPGGAPWFIAYAFISGLAMNGLQYYFLVKNGFAACYAVRLGHYLVWHILLGLYVQFIEL
ncbi:MAG: hypothetical protein MUF24_00695 [Chitinophagaceae bacterium]|jgi:hypothetical protein|nr:hypothetical protein [Chitinophagaceae bacterium]